MNPFLKIHTRTRYGNGCVNCEMISSAWLQRVEYTEPNGTDEHVRSKLECCIVIFLLFFVYENCLVRLSPLPHRRMTTKITFWENPSKNIKWTNEETVSKRFAKKLHHFVCRTNAEKNYEEESTTVAVKFFVLHRSLSTFSSASCSFRKLQSFVFVGRCSLDHFILLFSVQRVWLLLPLFQLFCLSILCSALATCNKIHSIWHGRTPSTMEIFSAFDERRRAQINYINWQWRAN